MSVAMSKAVVCFVACHGASADHFAYYENLEVLVPGQYSPTAAQVMDCAEGVVFANEKLATDKIYSAVGQEVDFTDKKRFGIGYYPISRAKEFAEKRETEYNAARLAFFKDRMDDKGQKVLVYFGGNNEVYFAEAFPAFLGFLDKAVENEVDLTNIVIVLQQHPEAKKTNVDRCQLEKWLAEHDGKKKMPKIVVSDFSSDQAQLFADAAFYYQTTMGPQFVLEGIPTVQIGHEKYEDVLVRNGLVPAVTTAAEFVDVIKTLGTSEKKSEEVLLEGIGYRKNWAEMLKKVIQESVS
jgi:hypothetical protein